VPRYATPKFVEESECSNRTILLRYVLQLAIADSLFLLSLPFKWTEDINKRWIYPEWMCKGKETMLFLNYNASCLVLVVRFCCHILFETCANKFDAYTVTIGSLKVSKRKEANLNYSVIVDFEKFAMLVKEFKSKKCVISNKLLQQQCGPIAS